jgi:hypothetical protein
MIIGKIETFPRRIPFKPGNHVTASAWGDKDLPAADSLLVKVTTDEGLEGWSETFGFRAVSSAKLAIDAPLCIADARNTNWEDSASHTTAHNRLTDFGKEVVHEVNRLGMVVDLAQLCDQTFYDALAVTTAPMILSHSLIRAISNVPRNMTDEMLRALAKNGGVIGINFGVGFINPRDAEGLRSATETRPKRHY